MIRDFNELENYVCGHRLGYGIHREVYEFYPNREYVIKIAIGENGRATNFLEEKLWREIDGTPVEKWFAPVISVSGCGKYLLQVRLQQIPKEQYPKEIPHFFTDTKYSNFGWLNKKGFVCCDYGSFNIFKGITAKLKKAEWWE